MHRQSKRSNSGALSPSYMFLELTCIGSGLGSILYDFAETVKGQGGKVQIRMHVLLSKLQKFCTQ